jgi:hypothetical protein
MIYISVLSILLQETLQDPNHHLLAAVRVREIAPQMVFVTRNGKAFRGSLNRVKEQYSLAIRHQIWVRYQTVRTVNTEELTDEPELGFTIAVQKEQLERFLDLEGKLASILTAWVRTYDALP